MLPDNLNVELIQATETSQSQGGTIPITTASTSNPLVGKKVSSATSNQSEAAQSFAETTLKSLPNDLTRMLYLGSLRDCNSGRYLHPQLSGKLGIETAHRTLCSYHDEVFRRLLGTPVSEYVSQLEEYIRYAKAERNNFLKTWHRLQAYRATVPMGAIALYREAFCLNVEAALMILTMPATGGPPQDADSQSS